MSTTRTIGNNSTPTSSTAGTAIGGEIVRATQAESILRTSIVAEKDRATLAEENMLTMFLNQSLSGDVTGGNAGNPTIVQTVGGVTAAQIANAVNSVPETLALSGDVTGGANSTVVQTVGGVTAAQIANAVNSNPETLSLSGDVSGGASSTVVHMVGGVTAAQVAAFVNMPLYNDTVVGGWYNSVTDPGRTDIKVNFQRFGNIVTVKMSGFTNIDMGVNNPAFKSNGSFSIVPSWAYPIDRAAVWNVVPLMLDNIVAPGYANINGAVLSLSTFSQASWGHFGGLETTACFTYAV